MDQQQNILIIGASGGIAQAIAKQKSKKLLCTIVGVSSRIEPLDSILSKWYVSDYSETSIELICQELKSQGKRFKEIYICNGQLHNDNFKPEKRLEDINQKQLSAIFSSNLITPALWIKHSASLLDKKTPSSLIAFSARVGSINDNIIGGWYSYRASKAALNMVMKTASIELQRRNPKARVICFHPGTTNTDLSKPFQKNVLPEKLFSASFVAEKLQGLLDKPNLANGFYDWNHQVVEW